MTQIDTGLLRSANPPKFLLDSPDGLLQFDALAIADEIDALRQQLDDANKCIAELEALLPKPPKMPEPISYYGGKPAKQYLREGD